LQYITTIKPSPVMKIKINTNWIVNAVVTAFGLLMLLSFVVWFLPFHFGGSSVEDDSSQEYYHFANSLKPIDPQLSDTLPYKKYKALQEKNKWARQLKNGEYLIGTSNDFFGAIGTYSGMLCDTCSGDNNLLNMPGTRQYYIKLPGWRLRGPYSDFRGDSTSFFVKNGQSFVRRPVINHTEKEQNSIVHTGYYADVPVKFRYNSEENCLMIPVTSVTKIVISYVIGVPIFLVIFYFLFLVAAFLKFVVDLSKGLSFTGTNVNRLRLIAFSFLAFPVINFLIVLLTRLVFYNYFTQDVVLNTRLWGRSWPMLCVGIVFLLLFRAFKQGKALKEEHDLTV
jgi:hypothetical protein